MENSNYFMPDTGRVIEIMSEKIARLEEENALVIAQNEKLVKIIQSMQKEEAQENSKKK